VIQKMKKRDRQDPWARLEHALVKRCVERSCTLHIRPGEARILKCDLLNNPVGFNRNMPMSDFLVFSRSRSSFMGPVEIKSGKFRVDKVRSQLENGAKHALYLSKGLPGFRSSHLLLVLVASRFGNELDQIRLRDPVQINGARYTIRPLRCGSKLADIVKRTQ